MRHLAILALGLLTACGAPTAPAKADISADAQAQARALYAYIVSLDTSEAGGQTPQMAAHLASVLTNAGIPAEDVNVLPMGETAALVARYRGDGTGGRPILFLGHMDVVPAKASEWERDPFTLTEEEGFFFGRGSFDNKAGIALMVSTFARLKSEGFTPRRDLILALTGDEETSQASAQALLADHRELIDAEFAINSDAGMGVLDEETGAPTSYSLQTAEKTYASFSLTARNPGGHSSLPRADNAIYDLAEALLAVRGHVFPVVWNDTTLAYFRAAGPQTSGALGAAMTDFANAPGEGEAADVLTGSPSTVGQIRTTCVPTLLNAGHAENALPQTATATVNCRIFPGESVEAVQAVLQSLAGDSISVAPLDAYYASDASPLRADVLAAAQKAVHASYPGVPIIPGMSAGATDGVFFRAAGIPTYGLADAFLKESDDYAHGLNERLPVASFTNGLTHWDVLIKSLAGSE